MPLESNVLNAEVRSVAYATDFSFGEDCFSSMKEYKDVCLCHYWLRMLDSWRTNRMTKKQKDNRRQWVN